MSKFGPDPAQIASHADHIVARHLLGGMPQRVDTSRVRGIHARVEASSSSAARPEPPTPGSRSGEAPQRLPHPSPPPARSPPRPMTTPERSHHGRRAELDVVRILAALRLSCSQQAPPSASPPSHAHGARFRCPNPLPKRRRAGATAVAATCFRGQAAMDRLEPRWVAQRVRKTRLVLPHPSIAADEASAGRNRELRRVLCFLSRPRTTGTNSTKARGCSAELMTQMNSVCGLLRDSWKVQGPR
jgi:hypothetical protein